MAKIVKIGNSQGIRIPKPIIEQAGLAGKELDFILKDEGLLLAPCKKPREGWDEKIKEIIAKHGEEKLDTEWLGAPLTDDKNWDW